jgi:hypothetical protein
LLAAVDVLVVGFLLPVPLLLKSLALINSDYCTKQRQQHTHRCAWNDAIARWW